MTACAQKRVVRGVLLLAIYWAAPVEAQQLEPRRWSHLPVGAQFIGAGYVRTEGDIFFDPALRVEDAKNKVDTFAVGYVHSISLWHRSARIDVDVPYMSARWEGLLDGEQRAVEREGFGDPRLRFSMLLVGAPALGGDEFSDYQNDNLVNTIVGAGVSLTLPLGKYHQDKLLNIGSNRFVLRPELGVVHVHNKWAFELTGSLSLFQDNEEFWPGDTELSQNSLFLVQGHVIHTFRPGLWVSVSGGYGFGGESVVDGIESDDTHDNIFGALTLGFPLSRTQGIKLAYAGVRTGNLVGSDSEILVIAWSVLF